FFGSVLEHLLVEEELCDQDLEALDLGFEFTDAACIIDLDGVVLLAPAVVGVLGNAEFATDVGDREPLGQVAVGLPKQPSDLLCGPSLAHESLLDLFYPDQDSHNGWTNFRGADHDARRAPASSIAFTPDGTELATAGTT